MNLELLLLLLQQVDELGDDVLHLVLRLDGQRVVVRQSGRVELRRVQRQFRLQREVRVALEEQKSERSEVTQLRHAEFTLIRESFTSKFSPIL